MRGRVSMRRMPWGIHGNHEEGQNLVEFAFLSFALFLLILGIIGFSLIYSAYLSLSLAVNTAARAAAVIDWNHADPTGQYDMPIYNELVGSLLTLPTSQIESITIYRPTDPNGGIGSIRNVLNKFGTRTFENYTPENRTRDTYIGVQVVYRQPVIIPLISEITGEELLITRRASFRIQ